MQKLDLNFSISCTDIGGQYSNYPEVELHFQEVKPHPMFIAETELKCSVPVEEFKIPGYLPLLQKTLSHGLGS